MYADVFMDALFNLLVAGCICICLSFGSFLRLLGILKMVLHQPNLQPIPMAMGGHGNTHTLTGTK